MSTLGDIVKAVREVAIINERVAQAAETAKSALVKAEQNRERIIVIETVLNMGLRGRGLPLLGQ